MFWRTGNTGSGPSVKTAWEPTSGLDVLTTTLPPSLIYTSPTINPLPLPEGAYGPDTVLSNLQSIIDIFSHCWVNTSNSDSGWLIVNTSNFVKILITQDQSFSHRCRFYLKLNNSCFEVSLTALSVFNSTDF